MSDGFDDDDHRWHYVLRRKPVDGSEAGNFYIDVAEKVNESCRLPFAKLTCRVGKLRHLVSAIIITAMAVNKNGR